jgi:hypothetical protein
MEKERDFFDGWVIVRCGTYEQAERIERICEGVLDSKPVKRFLDFGCSKPYGVRIRYTVDTDWVLSGVCGSLAGHSEMFYEQFLERYEPKEEPKEEVDFLKGDVIVRCETIEKINHIDDVCESLIGSKAIGRCTGVSGTVVYGVRMLLWNDGRWGLTVVGDNKKGLPEMSYLEFLIRYDASSEWYGYQVPTNHRPSTDQVTDQVTDQAKHEVNATPHHYASVIQAIDYIEANGLDFREGNVVKYVTRWRKKGGVKDLEKAKYYIERLIKEAKDGNND